ncbi:hypothetical protein QFZ63_002540 [Streptomyces sp. B3I7]|nr:hypothetical protein [Streptomyces sp. B3I7]
MVSESPVLSASFCRTGMMVALGARPTKPVPARGRAAMMPATFVPWPTWSSVGSPPLFPARKSRPADLSTAEESWGFLSSTPVSMTATRTPLPLSVPCQSWSSRTRWRNQGVPLICLAGNVHAPLPSSRTGAVRRPGAASGSRAARGTVPVPTPVSSTAAVSRAALVGSTAAATGAALVGSTPMALLLPCASRASSCPFPVAVPRTGRLTNPAAAARCWCPAAGPSPAAPTRWRAPSRAGRSRSRA